MLERRLEELENNAQVQEKQTSDSLKVHPDNFLCLGGGRGIEDVRLSQGLGIFLMSVQISFKRDSLLVLSSASFGWYSTSYYITLLLQLQEMEVENTRLREDMTKLRQSIADQSEDNGAFREMAGKIT